MPNFEFQLQQALENSSLSEADREALASVVAMMLRGVPGLIVTEDKGRLAFAHFNSTDVEVIGILHRVLHRYEEHFKNLQDEDPPA